MLLGAGAFDVGVPLSFNGGTNVSKPRGVYRAFGDASGERLEGTQRVKAAHDLRICRDIVAGREGIGVVTAMAPQRRAEKIDKISVPER
jgi:hypothetical protein